jgi:hypothetical protein
MFREPADRNGVNSDSERQLLEISQTFLNALQRMRGVIVLDKIVSHVGEL